MNAGASLGQVQEYLWSSCYFACYGGGMLWFPIM